MIYFLDFDRTLFDTDSFKKTVPENPEERSNSFAPGELAPFVYPDVPEFLRMLGNEAIIITYGDKRWQQAKIESALSGVVRLTVLYTEDLRKGAFLAAHPHLVSASSCFADDQTHELEAMQKLFPSMMLYEMRRDGGAGDGRWPVIHSLNGLPG